MASSGDRYLMLASSEAPSATAASLTSMPALRQLAGSASRRNVLRPGA
jgi:hypothetical protein